MRSLEITMLRYLITESEVDSMRRNGELSVYDGVRLRDFPELSIVHARDPMHVKLARDPRRPAAIISIPASDSFVHLREIPIMVMEGLQRAALGESCYVASNAAEFPYFATLQLDGIVYLEIVMQSPLRKLYAVKSTYLLPSVRVVAIRAAHKKKLWNLVGGQR